MPATSAEWQVAGITSPALHKIHRSGKTGKAKTEDDACPA